MNISNRGTLLVLIAVATLIGCGGGGSGNQATTTPPTTNEPEAIETRATVGIAEAIPEPARRLIANVSGANGTQAFNDSLQISTTISSNYPLVVATTAASEIVLASVQGSTTVELSASSTALALVRLLLELPPSVISEQDVLRLIETHESYSVLVMAVEAALDGGIAPSKDPAVLRTAALIASAVTSQGLSAKASAANRLTAMALSDASRDVVSPLPFQILSLPIGKISITGGLVNVSNSTPLAWSARSSTYQGKPLLSGEKAAILLPSADLATWAQSQLPGGLAPTGQPLPNDEDRAFNLTVEQSDDSRKNNIIELVSAVIAQVASIDGMNEAGTCSKELAEALLNSDLASLDNAPSGVNLVNYLASAGTTAAATQLANLTNSAPRLCPGSLWSPRKERLSVRLVPLAARLNLIVSTYQVLDTAASAGMLAGRLYWLIKNWSTSETVSVCVANNQIANCAARFEFINDQVLIKNLRLLEGAQHTPNLRAYDNQDRLTAVPSSVRFSSDSAALTVDKVSGALSAGPNPGRVDVTAYDEATEAKGTMTVWIDSGMLTPSSQNLDLSGAASSVSLVSSSETPIITTGVDLEWWLADSALDLLKKDSAIVQLFAGLGARQGLVFPKSVGKTNVVVYNPVSGRKLYAPIIVTGEFSFEVVEADPPLNARLDCTHFENIEFAVSGYYASFDQCTSRIDARIRCNGSGCAGERFKVAIVQTNIIDNCNGSYSLLSDLDTAAANQPYSPSSPFWFTLGDSTKAWPSISAISPLTNGRAILMNFHWIGDAPTGWTYCNSPTVSLSLIYNVYDTVEDKYYKVPFDIVVP